MVTGTAVVGISEFFAHLCCCYQALSHDQGTRIMKFFLCYCSTPHGYRHCHSWLARVTSMPLLLPTRFSKAEGRWVSHHARGPGSWTSPLLSLCLASSMYTNPPTFICTNGSLWCPGVLSNVVFVGFWMFYPLQIEGERQRDPFSLPC